jgi:circadian clock protein KaiB
MKARSVSKARKDMKPPDKIWDLRLYVSDRTLKSVAAFTNLTRVCHEHPEHKYQISAIDIEKSPQLAKENDIVAIPTLVKTYPLPMRRVIGDLSNTGRVLAGLDLPPIMKNNVCITNPLHGRS